MFFTSEGEEVELDASAIEAAMSLRWLDPNNGEWASEEVLDSGMIRLAKPGDGQWVAVVLAATE